MEWKKDNYIISTDKGKLDINVVHDYLSQSYWAKGISKEIVERSITGSLCFGLYTDQKQIGFARVISDHATFAYLADVFILPGERGKGLSKWLMSTIMEHPQLQGLRRFTLATRDAHGLYSQFGFQPFSRPDRWMEIHNADVYRSSEGKAEVHQ